MTKQQQAYTPDPDFGWCTEQQALVWLSTGKPVGSESVHDARRRIGRGDPEPAVTAPMHYRTTIPGVSHGAQHRVVAFCGDQLATLATSERGRVDCKLCLLRMRKAKVLR